MHMARLLCIISQNDKENTIKEVEIQAQCGRETDEVLPDFSRSNRYSNEYILLLFGQSFISPQMYV